MRSLIGHLHRLLFLLFVEIFCIQPVDVERRAGIRLVFLSALRFTGELHLINVHLSKILFTNMVRECSERHFLDFAGRRFVIKKGHT